jgi:hypothetical protein
VWGDGINYNKEDNKTFKSLHLKLEIGEILRGIIKNSENNSIGARGEWFSVIFSLEQVEVWGSVQRHADLRRFLVGDYLCWLLEQAVTADNAVTRWKPQSSAGGGSCCEEVIQGGERDGGGWWHYRGGEEGLLDLGIIFSVDNFIFPHKPGSVTLTQVKTWNLRRNRWPARETIITDNISSSTNLISGNPWQ